VIAEAGVPKVEAGTMWVAVEEGPAASAPPLESLSWMPWVQVLVVREGGR
jgi:hypothetical protein